MQPVPTGNTTEVTGRDSNATLDLFDAGPTNLPVLRPDETLYSWCAATHVLNGYVNAVRTSQRLFDAKYAALAHDIPSHLDQLHPGVAVLLPDSAALARHHSLLGYYLPWLSEEKVHLAESHSTSGIPKDIKIHLGLPASRLGALHPLKACADCIAADVRTDGWAFWHVIHQYPTVWICTKHRTPLMRLSLSKSPRHYRHWLLPTIDGSSAWRVLNAPNRHELLRLANLSSKLPTLAPASLEPTQLSQTYQNALRRADLVSDGGSLRLLKLTRAVQSHYQGLRRVPGFHILDSLADDLGGFIGSVARRQPRRVHPFKHLLVINWLFDDFDDFLAAYADADLPMNPQETEVQTEALDSRQAVFVSLVNEYGLSLSAAGRQVGVTPTTAVRWAKLHRISYVHRTKKMTSEVTNQCRSLLMAGWAKTSVAREAKVSMTTIARLLSSDPELRQAWQRAIFLRRRRRNRERLLTLLDKYPGVPVKTLRSIPGNGYSWLYRNDRDWLIEHLPMLK